MYRPKRITVLLLLVGVVIGAIYLPRLADRVLRLRTPPRADELARREMTQPPVATPTDVKVKSKIYWAAPGEAEGLEPVVVELPLSSDPAQRAKQVINALISSPPSEKHRTLPAEVTLLELYLLPGGTVVADLSDTLATATPSGILSEQMAVDSIARTLEANVASLRRLKILVHGQEVETLAGHVDLTDFFELRAAGTEPAGGERPAQAPPAPGESPSARYRQRLAGPGSEPSARYRQRLAGPGSEPSARYRQRLAGPGSEPSARGKLTPPSAPGKLER